MHSTGQILGGVARPAVTSRRLTTLAALGCLAFGAVGACGDDDDANSCELDTGESTVSGDITVEYTATATGEAELSTITYATDDGLQVVESPTLPFSQEVMLATARASMQAMGTVSSGEVTISYAVTSAENPEQNQAMCSA